VTAKEDDLSQVVPCFLDQRGGGNTDVSLVQASDLLAQIGNAQQVDAARMSEGEAQPLSRSRRLSLLPGCPLCLADGGGLVE
jgi:hypothetical protein